MANEILNSLLKEYEQKKLKSEIDLEKRKEELYTKIPKLKEIEDELNYSAIQIAKQILNNQDSSLITSLQNKIDNLKKQKQNILKSENIEPNYLEPYYECALCKDTGYIKDNYSQSQMCSCLKQKLLDNAFNKSNMTNLNNQNFEKFNELIFSNKVEFEKYKRNISPRDNIINIKNRCEAFIDNFDNPNHKNLLFTGNTGLR